MLAEPAGNNLKSFTQLYAFLNLLSTDMARVTVRLEVMRSKFDLLVSCWQRSIPFWKRRGDSNFQCLKKSPVTPRAHSSKPLLQYCSRRWGRHIEIVL